MRVVPEQLCERATAMAAHGRVPKPDKAGVFGLTLGAAGEVPEALRSILVATNEGMLLCFDDEVDGPAERAHHSPSPSSARSWAVGQIIRFPIRITGRS